MRLVTLDPDVESVVIEQDSDVRRLGRLATLERLALRQRPYGRRPLPVGFIESPIDVNRSGRSLRRRVFEGQPITIRAISVVSRLSLREPYAPEIGAPKKSQLPLKPKQEAPHALV